MKRWAEPLPRKEPELVPRQHKAAAQRSISHPEDGCSRLGGEKKSPQTRGMYIMWRMCTQTMHMLTFTWTSPTLAEHVGVCWSDHRMHKHGCAHACGRRARWTLPLWSTPTSAHVDVRGCVHALPLQALRLVDAIAVERARAAMLTQELLGREEELAAVLAMARRSCVMQV